MPEVERIRQKNWTPDSVINSHPWTLRRNFFCVCSLSFDTNQRYLFFLAPRTLDSGLSQVKKKIAPWTLDSRPGLSLRVWMAMGSLCLPLRTPDSGLRTQPQNHLLLRFRTPDCGLSFRYKRLCPPPEKGPKCAHSGLRTLDCAVELLNAIVCEALLAEARQHLLSEGLSKGAAEGRVEAAAVRELQASHAALEEAATVGRQLLPLRSPAELATLLQAELLYPPGTPKRSYKVLEELRTRRRGVAVPSEFELDLLLSRLHASDDWNRALRSMTVPGEQRCVLVPPVTECVVCGSTQLVHARDGRSRPRTVFSRRGKLCGELCGMQYNRGDCGAVALYVICLRRQEAAAGHAALLQGRGGAAVVRAACGRGHGAAVYLRKLCIAIFLFSSL